MLAVFTKTLYQKRWMMLAWVLGLSAMVVFTLIFYPTLKDSEIANSFKDLPPQLAKLAGDNLSFASASGYIGEQIFGLRMPLIMIILGISLFSNLTATEEDRGNVAEQLSLPLSRTRLLLEKYLAGVVVLAIAHLAVIVSILVTLQIINDSAPFWSIVATTFLCFMISLVFASLAFALGCITGRKAWTIGIASYLAFQTYLVSSLVESVDALKIVDYFSPFHYYHAAAVMRNGLEYGNVVVLAAISLSAFVLGWLVFNRRDLKN